MNLSPFFFKISLLILCCCGVVFTLHAQDGHDSKLVFGQTAKPLQAGQGYVYSIDGLVYAAEVGLTRFLSVGTGTLLSFGRGDGGAFYGGGLRAKLAFPVGERWYVGVSTTALRQFGHEYSSAEMSYLASGIVTADWEEVQLTFGLGLISGFDLADPDSKPIPLMSSGVIVPLFHKFYLVNENQAVFFSSNYSENSYVFVSTLVARWGLESFSFDVGLLGYYGDDGDGRFGRVLPQASISFHFTN